MKNSFFFLVFFCAQILNAQILNVSADSLIKHVNFLAGAECKGRLPGDIGYDKAIKYSIDYFKYLGLTGLNDSWLQTFPLETNIIDDADVVIKIGSEKKVLKHGYEFSVRGYSGSGKINSKIVFCGYGADLPNYSDYKGVDVKNKIAMVFKANPPFIPNLPQYSIRQAADNAYRHGAKGIIFISQPNQKNPQKPIGSMMHGPGPMHADFPQVQIEVEMAEKIMQDAGYSLSDLQSEIDSKHEPKSICTNSKAYIFVKATYNPNGETSNVISVLQGNDDVLKDEYVIIFAHLDHVGFIGDHMYYPGATDNASGSAAIYELARVLSLEKQNIKRSIMFVLFSSEEKGLDGSEYFVNNLPVPKEKIYAAFNMDCIGYGDTLKAGNGLSCPRLWQIALEEAAKENFIVSKDTWKGGGADLTPFYKAGIDGLYFVNTGAHEYLHLPTDKPETINKDIFSKMVKWIANILYRVANE
ncbi:MAG: M20/M25/M40 family metallo-hydrolase [Bacteroidales bacterium]|nr:M20/M25/M40 family metallo-hydrolase [Bacteroidales bacterium]